VTPRRSIPAALAALAMAAAAPGRARAELVILTDGNTFKVRAYEVADDRAELTFANGGRLALPIDRVDRILDDEVEEPAPAPVVAALPAAAAAPALALAFDATQGVPEGPFGAQIFDAARRHQVNPKVVAAVMHAESAGNPRAVSRAGARGLMQLMPATAERFGVPTSRLFEPGQNLEAGVRYLRFLIEQFPNDLARVLAAYNAGEQAVVRYGGIPPYRETKGYVRRIYSLLGLSLAG